MEKVKMKNKYMSAGVMNIVCGVFFTLLFIGVMVLINVGFISTGTEDGIVYAALFTLVGAYVWDILMYFPFFMILTGVEMCSKHKKGVGVVCLILVNILLKAYLVYIAVNSFIPFAILFAVSIIMDIRALFRK